MRRRATGAALALLTILPAAGMLYGYFHGTAGIDRMLDEPYMRHMVREHYALSALSYIGIYILLTAVSFPATMLVTVAGGFLFGTLYGTLYAVIGSTAGSLGVFLTARLFLGTSLNARYAVLLRKVNEEIRENGSHYMVALRIFPFFPYYVVNVAAGLSGMRPVTFLWTTVAGILPGTLALAFAGDRAGTLRSPDGLLSGKVLTLLALMALLAVMPAAARKILKYRRQRTGEG